ncbi:MAG: YdbL family protein [Betaproteobacteria bacterium]|nr:YdbL family protein [Betaproteobacteria bacterium]
MKARVDYARGLLWMLVPLFLALAPVARAQQPNFHVNTPGIDAIRDQLRADFHQLKPYFENGTVGPTAEGLLAIRDLSAVPLPDRARVTALVADDNAHRRELYQGIAVANGHPEWASDIQATFAQRWIALERPGWWYRNASGTWVQK